MALTGTETYGEVIAGFVTDEDGNLSVTTDDSEATEQMGFLRDPDGRLVVAEESGDWQEGFIRNSAGALCVSTGTVTDDGTVVPGFPTDADGLLVVANDGTPAASSVFPGFMFDNGKLCVTGLSGGGGGGATLYDESFTDDDGGWTSSGATNSQRWTFHYNTAPAGYFYAPDNYTADSYVISPKFALTDVTSASFYVKKAGTIPQPVAVYLIYYDVDDNALGGDLLQTLTNSELNSWVQKTTDSFTVPEGTTQGAVFLTDTTGDFWDGAGFVVDDVLVEGTA